MRHNTILVAILAFVPLANATAQVPVRPGARVRVTGHFCQPFYSNCVGGSPQHRVGSFVAWKADTLVVQSNGDTLSVPVDLVTTLDVSRGRKSNAATGAGIGLVVGMVTGAVLGYASFEECVSFCIASVDGRGETAIVGAVLLGLGGIVVGAVTGAFIKTDRWEEVPLDRLRLQVAPQRDGRFGLGLSMRF